MGTRYVALLRGINVGWRNRITMADLRDLFSTHGYDAVETYIQSGNVLFESAAPAASLEPDIEAALEQRFGTPLVVVVRSLRQLRNVVARAPDGFGTSPDHLADVIFLKRPLTADRAMRVVQPRDGVDRVWTGPGALYVDRVAARRAQSRLSRVASAPEYQLMTIRNWATTTRLLAMLGNR